MLGFLTVVYGQSRQLSGKIRDNLGEGLPGVTVLVKGTSTGTTTDFDGNFSLEVPADAVLVISSIGFKTQEITLGAQTNFDLTLEEDVEELSEVVVIGYGKVEKGDITGVVAQVNSKEFNKGMITTPESLIAGKIAGVQITSNDGSPGAQSSIRIRGVSSLNASNEPLFVVDGVALDNTAHNPGGQPGGRNPLSFINPSDIEDITVLKDASAAAIYGARAAGGVIIITTKSGKSGKLQLSYDGSYSVGSIISKVDMLDATEFRAAIQTKAPSYISTLGDADTDWVDEVTQVAQSTIHNVSASFGGKTNSGRVALNYQNIEGALLFSQAKRYTISSNLTQRLLNENLVINLINKTSFNEDVYSPNVMGAALTFAPTEFVRADNPLNGDYFEWDDQELAVRNPVSILNQTTQIGSGYRVLTGGNVTYKIPFVKGLSAKINLSHDQSESRRQSYQPETLRGARNSGGSYNYEVGMTRSTLSEYYLTYERDLPSVDSKFDVLGGYSFQNFFKQYPGIFKNPTVSTPLPFTGNPSEFVSDAQRKQWFDQDLVVDNNAFEFENRLLSYWGRVNLTIKEKYLVTATLRRDGSTRFSPSNRFGTFPSLAVGWRVLDESFASPLRKVFSDFKLRLSYGVTGNQEIQDYAYLNLYQPSDDRARYIFGNDTITTYRPAAIDPNIKWEETNSLNLGIDYGILGGRLYGSVEFYNKITTDMLSVITFPIGVLPGDRALTNIGEMESRGVELQINAIAIDRDDFNVSFGLNGAYNKNELAALDNSNLPDFPGYEAGPIIAGDVGRRIQVNKVGNPVNSFLVYKHKIIDGKPASDRVDHNGDGIRNLLDIYEDLNEDGVINEDDKRIYNDPAPDFIFGFTSNLTFRKWDMAMTWRAQIGNYVYNNVSSQYGAYDVLDNPFSPNNVHISAFENDFQSLQLESDVYVENASFLKLDNITVGYRFKPTEKLRSRAYVTASNLLQITGYSGVDPEVGLGGVDNNIYPRTRMFIVGLNVSFN